MPVTLPRRLARFNRAVVNPIQSQYAWLVPPWVVIIHRGRRTGRRYRTPVNAYRRADTLTAVVLYGESSDWVRNVLAGGGRVVRAGRTYELREPRLVSVASIRATDGIPRIARLLGRVSGKLLVAGLDGPVGGFGRGEA